MIGGVLICNDDDLAQRLRFTQNAVGAVTAPWDSFLLLRSTKTLHVRVQRHCENAAKIADFLAEQNADRARGLSRPRRSPAARHRQEADASAAMAA